MKNQEHQVPPVLPEGRRRIVNRVRFPNGTATVSAETVHRAKAGHWGAIP